MGDGVHQGERQPPHPPTQGWMSRPADLVLSCCSFGGLFPLSPPPWDAQCFCAVLWWEQQTLWKQTEGMTLTSLGFSFWKTEPIAPICQVYFNRCVDFCEMVRVKAAVLGLGLGDAQQLWFCLVFGYAWERSMGQRLRAQVLGPDARTWHPAPLWCCVASARCCLGF